MYFIYYKIYVYLLFEIKMSHLFVKCSNDSKETFNIDLYKYPWNYTH